MEINVSVSHITNFPSTFIHSISSFCQILQHNNRGSDIWVWWKSGQNVNGWYVMCEREALISTLSSLFELSQVNAAVFSLCHVKRSHEKNHAFFFSSRGYGREFQLSFVINYLVVVIIWMWAMQFDLNWIRFQYFAINSAIYDTLYIVVLTKLFISSKDSGKRLNSSIECSISSISIAAFHLRKKNGNLNTVRCCEFGYLKKKIISTKKQLLL